MIAVIERPAIVRQILDHLGLPTPAPRLRAPPDPPKDLAAEPPREWSYEPIFEDLPLPDPLHGEPGPRGRFVRPGHGSLPGPRSSA